MPIDPDELERLRRDHQRVAGQPFQHYRCPITLEDGIGPGLINGHIVNQAVPDAARSTVIQRGDVDNHFGATIEPLLLHFLELGVHGNTDEIMQMRPKITAIGRDGRRWPAFVPASRSQPQLKFTAVKLNVASGPEEVYVKATPEELGPNPQIEISTAVESLSHVGALLKTAHLCLFRLLGYSWVLDWPGNYVRQPLAKFFQRKLKADGAERIFSPFRGSCATMLDAKPDAPDSLTHSLFLMHAMSDGVLFGLSCLFNLNHKLTVVTVPYWRPAHHGGRIRSWMKVLGYYNCFIADRSIPHTTTAALRQGEKWVLATESHPTVFEGTLPSKIEVRD